VYASGERSALQHRPSVCERYPLPPLTISITPKYNSQNGIMRTNSRNLTIPTAVVPLVVFTAALHADDGAASVAAGGIVLRKEPRITMQKEILTSPRTESPSSWTSSTTPVPTSPPRLRFRFRGEATRPIPTLRFQSSTISQFSEFAAGLVRDRNPCHPHRSRLREAPRRYGHQFQQPCRRRTLRLQRRIVAEPTRHAFAK
jgi:hypothetical protein